MKLIILGDGEVGKDEVASSISRQFSIPTMSSSLAARDIVFANSKKLQFKYVDAVSAWEDRRTPDNRILWHDAICEINKDDPTRLCSIIMEKSDIYVGMRSHRELIACQKVGLCDLSIWVRSDIRGANESSRSNGITHDMADVEFCNNHSDRKSLDRHVYRVFSKILRGVRSGVPLVYCAGPYSGDVDGNVNRAIDTWNRLKATGIVTPFLPHLSHYIDKRHPGSYEHWMGYCFDMVDKCDALLRMPGMSPGSDREVARAREIGIPVFNAEENLINHFNNR
jgi:hypothetical protein